MAPAFHHNDFRCNSLWFKTIAKWHRCLVNLGAVHQQPHGGTGGGGGGRGGGSAAAGDGARGTEYELSSHTARLFSDTAAFVFNAPKSVLRWQLEFDGLLRVGWGNGLPLSYLGSLCDYLPTADLFQVAYMYVGAPAGLMAVRAQLDGCLLYTSPSPRDRG